MIPSDRHIQIRSLLFEGLDQIDLTGPFEVLSRIPNSTYRVFANFRLGARRAWFAPDARCGARRSAKARCIRLALDEQSIDLAQTSPLNC
jgi:hypothetical protein